MALGKKLFKGAGAAAAFDPLQNFETVTYTGNGSTQKITGYIRKGAAFNGSSSYIESGISTDILNSDYTISFWGNTSNSSGGQTFINTNNGSAVAFVRIDYSANGNLFFYHRNSASAAYGNVSIVSGMADGNWHHVVVTKDDTSVKVYKDGNLEATITSTNGTYSNSTTLQIGRNNYNTDGANNFDGKIDQVRIFDKALSSSEVTTLYGETYASSTKSTTDIFGDGSAVALYELDEDADTTPYYPYGTGDIDAGQSAVFNGSSSKITTVASQLPIPASGAFTVSFWAKVDSSLTLYNTCMMSFGDFWLKSEYQTGRFSLGDVNAGYETTSSMGYGWNHCVLTVDASNNINLYLNGANEFTGNKSISRTNGGNFAIGLARLSNPVYYFNGKIDQVRIYSSALSASDVEALVSETNVPTANLVAHYKLDGNANDETGSYNGTASNLTYSDPAEFPLIAYNGTPTNVNFLGMAFQPDLVWVKSRSIVVDHAAFDSVRGDQKYISPSTTGAEGTYSTVLTSFDSNGFTVGSNAGVNQSGSTYVAWCWKAGGSVAPNNNTVGDITSTVSANQDAGFSIVKWTGDGNASSTVGHGLSSKAELIIQKTLSTTGGWFVVSSELSNNEYLALQATIAATTDAGSSGAPASVNNNNDTTFGFRSGSSNVDNVNKLNDNYIAYCFHSVDGYQKIGSYTGTGSSGLQVTTGFRPRFIIIKATSRTSAWLMMDTARDTVSPLTEFLVAQSSGAEFSASALGFGINDTGFSVDNTDGTFNENFASYIYLAIA